MFDVSTFLHYDYSLTKATWANSLQIGHCILKVLRWLLINQNDHKPVAFVIYMYSFITLIICWKTIANIHNYLYEFVRINFVGNLSGSPG